MSLKPIDDRQEKSIMSTLTLSGPAPHDPHARASYLTGVQLAVARYNRALKAEKPEAEVAELVGKTCADSFFRDGHPRDERVTLMAAQAQWSAPFTDQVEHVIGREEEKYKNGAETSSRKAFFSTRALAQKNRGGFERWRGSSE
ncbi:MAG: hypothetical protein EBV03_01685 [Proteobacteria bacterium]|nr:hypothetical protein [Pseudomonadota bacterium]